MPYGVYGTTSPSISDVMPKDGEVGIQIKPTSFLPLPKRREWGKADDLGGEVESLPGAQNVALIGPATILHSLCFTFFCVHVQTEKQEGGWC